MRKLLIVLSLIYAGHVQASEALCDNDLEMLKRVLTKENISSKVCSGSTTPLVNAISQRHFTIAEYLLEEGADANQNVGYVPSERRPLFVLAASLNAPYSVLRKFVDQGIILEARDDYWGTALCAAAQSQSVDSVLALLKLGADVTFFRRGGQPPLGCAVDRLRINVEKFDLIVKELVAKGADINRYGMLSQTPLHACLDSYLYQRLPTVKVLLKYGANPHIRSGRGFTALDLAEKNGHDDVAKYLRNLK